MRLAALARVIERVIWGRSAAIRRLRDEIRALAHGGFEAVLVLGETGTGKDLAARALHALARPGRPYVALNCPAVPADHLESEVFGTVRGAYTGAVDRPGAAERAGAGTLLLDEIGSMTLAHQAKILRLLENREASRLGGGPGYRVEAALVAATHEDPRSAVREGRLRADLYYRLAQDAVLLVPPLRERAGDVPLLAQRFLDERGAFVLTPGAIVALEREAWRGNVRELRAVVRTASRMAGPSSRGTPLHEKHVRRALERIAIDQTPVDAHENSS